MQSPLTAISKSLLEQVYAEAFSFHGDLDLDLKSFSHHVLQVVAKHQQTRCINAPSLSIFRSLHTTDLYLSIACTLQRKRAWSRFNGAYSSYIRDIAASASSSTVATNDLASDILGDMFLPNRSGQSRIAAYDGQVTLATWLRVIIIRRALNERNRKLNNIERLDNLPDIADCLAAKRLEANLRASLYDKVVVEALKAATNCLSERERLMLMLRFEDGMEAKDIAAFLGAHASTVSRQLQRIYKKLRNETRVQLMTKHTLGASAVEECEAEILENPAHCIML